MEILVTICARGGSKGIPDKNIRLLNNKPLIFYSIVLAQKFSKKKNAIVSLSTDDDEIKKIAASFGLNSNYKRPDNLATDDAGKAETIKDLVLYEEKRLGNTFEYVLDLDVTSPFRNLDDLNTAFEIIQNDTNALNLFSVNVANRNPYFNMVEEKENGYYGLVKTGNFLTRQSAPKVYELNASFYFYRRQFFEQNVVSTISEKSLVHVIPHTCFDLDHPVDFEFMDFLLRNNKLDFVL